MPWGPRQQLQGCRTAGKATFQVKIRVPKWPISAKIVHFGGAMGLATQLAPSCQPSHSCTIKIKFKVEQTIDLMKIKQAFPETLAALQGPEWEAMYIAACFIILHIVFVADG
jgi:hypothetical protein